MKINKLLCSIVLIPVILFFYRCPFRFFLGISCPGCGMTRAMDRFFHMKVGEAFYYHPLFPIVIIVAVLYALWRFNWISLSEKQVTSLVVAVSILFLVVYVIRIISHSDVLEFDIGSSFIVRTIQKL